MKFACLVYRDPDIHPMELPANETLVEKARAYDNELRERGHFILGQALQPVASAVTLRTRNGRMTATDGPFAETKEQLAGFFLIEARDLDEAVEVAKASPMAPVATIEVRPFYVRS
jgi:hypothetical protein